MIPKILIIPARRHIIESYTEYLIRYLGDEFYFEMGYPPAPPYDNIRERIRKLEISPLHKNPDDFDLIYPHFPTHWYLDPQEEYAGKIAIAMLEPNQTPRFMNKIAVLGVTSSPLEEIYPNAHKLRFGVDTNLFFPFPQARLDDKVHVGFIGNIQTPRRYLRELFMPLSKVPGVKIDIYPTSWLSHTRPDEVVLMGGNEVLDNIVDGDKWLTGLPNIYNRMDIFVRCDIEHGYQFSVMEAAACGIPVVCTDSGISKELTDAGGGVLIDCISRSWDKENLAAIHTKIRQAVEDLRDNPSKRIQMGIAGRKFVEKNYTWDKFIPSWREFFREGLKNANFNSLSSG